MGCLREANSVVGVNWQGWQGLMKDGRSNRNELNYVDQGEGLDFDEQSPKGH
jgi:hypothetical protein